MTTKHLYDYTLKFIVVGESSVGKSNLMLQFTDNRFQPTHDLTIGVEFGTKLVSCNDTIYKIQIWDTAGQEAFRSITQSYYKGSIGCLLVYDITNRRTFNEVTKWLTDLRRLCDEHTVIILVGNKVDLESEREVSYDEGMHFALDNDLVFFETSAKMGDNVQNSFNFAIQKIDDNIKSNVININTSKGVIIVKDNPFEERTTYCGC